MPVFAGAQMPELLDIVLTGWAGNVVADVQHIRLLKPDAAAMGESSVLALRFYPVLRSGRLPIQNPNMWLVFPAKRIHRHGLIGAGNANGIVGRRSPEQIAPARIGVGVRSGIDQDLAAAHAHG